MPDIHGTPTATTPMTPAQKLALTMAYEAQGFLPKLPPRSEGLRVVTYANSDVPGLGLRAAAGGRYLGVPGLDKALEYLHKESPVTVAHLQEVLDADEVPMMVIAYVGDRGSVLMAGLDWGEDA